MTLTTHIVIAGAITKPLITGAMGPLGLFLVSVGSHYLADTIPHYDYKLRYFVDEKDGEVAPPFRLFDFLIRDVGKVALDILIGTTLLFLATGAPPTGTTLLLWSPVILGAILPDLLQGLRWIVPGMILNKIQKVQDFVHARKLFWSMSAVFSQLLILFLAFALIQIL